MTAPHLMKDLGIDRDALAPALAAALFGMTMGSPGVGALGDRWGRRPTRLCATGAKRSADTCTAKD
jgi:MFS family permease